MTYTYKTILLLIAAISVATGAIYYKDKILSDERERVNTEWQLREEMWQNEIKQKLLEKNQEVERRQQELNKVFESIAEKSQELENATQKYNDLRSKYANGTLRMSVPTAATSKVARAKQNNSPSPPAVVYENRELMPELSTAILEFARDYQRNLRLKDQCIVLYNAAREAVNE